MDLFSPSSTAHFGATVLLLYLKTLAAAISLVSRGASSSFTAWMDATWPDWTQLDTIPGLLTASETDGNQCKNKRGV